MITLLTNGRPSGMPRGEVTELDTYDIDRLNPGCRLLLMETYSDQVHLERNKHILDAFLGRQGTLVAAGGHLVREVFTGAPLWQEAPSKHQSDLKIIRRTPHPVWEGITEEELSIRCGIRGFYGRGGYPDLEPGDIIINTVQDMPLDVQLHRGGGRILLHGGNNMWDFGARDEPGRGIRSQLLRWGLSAWA